MREINIIIPTRENNKLHSSKLQYNFDKLIEILILQRSNEKKNITKTYKNASLEVNKYVCMCAKI